MENLKVKFEIEVFNSNKHKITFNSINIKKKLRNGKIRKINYQEEEKGLSEEEEEKEVILSPKKKSKVKYCPEEENEEIEKLSSEIIFDFEDIQKVINVKDDVDDYDWKGPENFSNKQYKENFILLESITPNTEKIEEKREKEEESQD